MADIFVSWASPDRVTVEALVNNLNAAGIPPWFSADPAAMQAGNEINETVKGAIQTARVALIVLSRNSAAREWIEREIAFADFAGLRLVPVVIDDLQPAEFPQLIRDKNINAASLSPGTDYDSRLTAVISTLYSRLNLDPVRVECALFAMTKNECENLPKENENWRTMVQLCQAVGVPEDQFTQGLAARYPGSLEEYSPFEDQQPFLNAVRKAIERTNRDRVARRRRPILLQWCHHEIRAADPNDAARNAARRRWRTGNSILIVDSVSMCHPDIQGCLRDLPQPNQAQRAAVLWIPPYTRYTEALQARISAATAPVPIVRDVFNDDLRKGDCLDRWMAFDIATPASLTQWIYRVGSTQPDEPSPLGSAVDNMHQGVKVLMSPANFF